MSRQQIYTHGACCPHTQHPIRLPAVGTRLNAVAVTSRYISPQGTFQLQPGAVKAVYIAPSKSLVQVPRSCSYQHVSLPPNMSESIAASSDLCRCMVPPLPPVPFLDCSQEQVANWSKRFGTSLGLKCQEMSGDTDAATDAAELNAADIICTTPEKFGELHLVQK